MVFLRISLATLLAGTAFAAAPPKMVEKDDPSRPVSYFKQIRPIFQANCQGCHQPAKAKGDYVMTDFGRMLAGGEDAAKDQKTAITPHHPEASHLFEMITPVDGKAEMPAKQPPLLEPERELVRRWIAEGASDDTPENARQRFDEQHPPTYGAPAVLTSIDFSPDGSLLAVAGFHEILLWRGDGSALVARLVGLSERIQMVRFSPDGTLLAAAAGRPAQMGEIQIWDVAHRKLLLSVPQGFDTLYGVSWSPDGKQIAFGCPDNSVRAIEASTGKQTMMMGLHSDWPVDTAWSVKGDHLISVSRDMSVKLTETASARFIDNVTSITPGALRGGINSVARHPTRDEVLIGGADGIPEVYRMFRATARRIGDNSNLLHRFPPMAGRIFSVGFAPDGRHCAAGSSLDGKGEIDLLECGGPDELPAEIIEIMTKTVLKQTAAEQKKLADYFAASGKVLHRLETPGGIYCVVWDHSGKRLAAAGEDGAVRLIDAEAGQIVKEFIPVPLNGAQVATGSPAH